MRVLHLADLHLGLRLHEQPLKEDQAYILEQTFAYLQEYDCQALLLAGDIYDAPTPSGESVRLADDFFTRLSQAGIRIMAISGNHDSPERLSFGSRLMDARGLYLAGSFRGAPERVTLTDEYGPLHFWLLPFLRPATVRPWLPADTAPPVSHEEAVSWAIDQCAVNSQERNVLIAHQFVTAAGTEVQRSDSEAIAVGGLDNVDASLFDSFDYVALGHIHRPQSVGRETVRYAGSPLKYSFSEARQQKSATMVELGAKGQIKITALPLRPRRELRELRGPLETLLRPENVAAAPADDYLRVTLTDDDYLLNASARLKEVYPHVLRLDYDNQRSRAALNGGAELTELRQQDPLALFCAFYEEQNGSQPAPALRECFSRELALVQETEA